MRLDADHLKGLLSQALPERLAGTLVDEYLQIRVDAATGTLGGTSPGKFIEAFVAALEYMEEGAHSSPVDVDGYLKRLEARASSLDDGLRICASRIARSVYTLRNKRNIVHLGDVDANAYDLGFVAGGAQWLLAELVRVVAASTMTEAGDLITAIAAPIGGLVEDFGTHRLVLASVNTDGEILLLLRSHYPDRVPTEAIRQSLSRRADSTVRNAIRRLWVRKWIDGNTTDGYRLTTLGFEHAVETARSSVR